MKLKYYLRGVGFGILMSVLVFGVALIAGLDKKNKNEATTKASYEPVVETAEPSSEFLSTLPSVEDIPSAVPIAEPTFDASMEVLPSVEPYEKPSVEVVKKPEETKPSEAPTAKPSVTPSVKPTEVPSVKPSPVVSEEVVITTEKKAITIKSGDDSYKVSKALKAAGLIKDAESFNQYLIEKKLEGKIQTGSFYITGGTPEWDIAQMLVDTKRRTTELQ